MHALRFLIVGKFAKKTSKGAKMQKKRLLIFHAVPQKLNKVEMQKLVQT